MQLENFKLTWKVWIFSFKFSNEIKLNSVSSHNFSDSFPTSTFQLNVLSNFTFQLHVSLYWASPLAWKLIDYIIIRVNSLEVKISKNFPRFYIWIRFWSEVDPKLKLVAFVFTSFFHAVFLHLNFISQYKTDILGQIFARSLGKLGCHDLK